MSGVDELDAEGLRRAFQAHLEHLSEFKGVRYVPRARVPIVEAAPESEQASPSPSEGAKQPAPETTPAPAKAPSSGASRHEASQWGSAKKLAYLRDKVVGDCRRCPLSKGRTKLVFGVGNPDADLVFVGEAPGRDEDRQGEPFVGMAGQRLNSWLQRFDLRREDVYIANVLKCRPPNNRDPIEREIETCSPFLHAQLRAIAPKAIVCLGRFAGNLLLRSQLRMYEMRGRVHRYEDVKHKVNIPVVVTYHPSYVLRREREGQRGQTNPAGDRKSEQEKVLDDLSRAIRLLRESR
jgi:DNA polymerase